MTLGALIVVAVLAVAAVEGTRFLKARAGGDQSSQVGGDSTSSISVAPSTGTPGSQPQTGEPNSAAISPTPGGEATQANGAFGAGSPTTPQVDSQATTGSLAALPSNQNPVSPGGNSVSAPRKARKNHTGSVNLAVGGQNASPQEGGGTGQVVAPSGGSGAGQVVQPPTGSSGPDAQELEQLGDQHDRLAIRAQSANEGVESLRKQMEASGNNLRSDITASQMRMKMYMDKFDAAMNAKDPVAAAKYMALAEREIEKLEKFLNH
jgi:hypothetical protein